MMKPTRDVVVDLWPLYSSGEASAQTRAFVEAFIAEDREFGDRLRREEGAGNSHFKDGTSYSKLFQEMRPLVLGRDGESCVVCQSTVRLVVHHVDHNPLNNDPTNLIALCNSCHMRHHKSIPTPFPWFAQYAAAASRSMTSRWRARTTSLQAKFSSTTAFSSTT